MCDANKLDSAILNLVINARDAMPHGGQVVIETDVLICRSPVPEGMHDIAPGDYVTVSVIDTGIGMSDDVAARAFDPFFTTKPLGQGTGLGLSMIYGFARQSEGYVKIRSQCGVGTAVTLYLPRCMQGQPTVERASKSVDEPHAGRGEVVVVVEDEPVVRALIVEVLGDRGYRVLEAKDGLSGLALLDFSRPATELHAM
ncbi:MAG: hybrid sensor histidine kinase/response regulator, partial [Burkholderiaceae bacterium]|nr:hybrid sensor histidine kinase/response regulator [Burkholderiaceae bacterium]